MSQLDITKFSPQIFFLLLTLITLYLFINNVILINLVAVVKLRYKLTHVNKLYFIFFKNYFWLYLFFFIYTKVINEVTQIRNLSGLILRTLTRKLKKN